MAARGAATLRSTARRWAIAVALGLAVTTVLAVPPAPAGAELPSGPATVVAGSAEWGVRSSFRAYVTDPFRGNGSITVSDGATTNADGTYHWPAATGTAEPPHLDAGFAGSVRFVAHGGALDLMIRELGVELTSATTGVIRADVRTLPLGGSEFVEHDDIAIADLQLAGITPGQAGETFTWSNVPATLTAEGSNAFAGFYPPGSTLDPITFALDLQSDTSPFVPRVTVSKTTGLDAAGETVTVTGTGFDPNANLSTRPPVPPGMPTGVYVVFGRFADPWQPSAGAPSTARRVLDQKWTLPAASKAAAEAAFGPNPQYVVLQPDGSFTTTLQLAPNETFSGDYGIATFAAGGAAPNASQETFTPISFLPDTGIDAAASIPSFRLRGNRDESTFKVTVTNADATTFAVGVDDIDVTVEVNGVEVDDPVVSPSPGKNLKAGKAGTFNFVWTHGASLRAGDIVEVTACVRLDGDDTSSNDCTSTVAPSGSFDVGTVTTFATINSKKTSAVLKSSVTNLGTAEVLLRPDDVSVATFVNGLPAGEAVVSKTPLGTRKLVKPTKRATYSFTWTFGPIAVGDVVKVVTCVPVPGDVSGGDNCSEHSQMVVK